MPEDTPVLDALAAITAVSIAGSELPARELVIARLAALVAVNAPPSSYLLNAGSAVEVGSRCRMCRAFWSPSLRWSALRG